MKSGNRHRVPNGGFTLVEVIVAIGIAAITVVALVALLAAGGRVAAEVSARNQAGNLADAVTVELLRLRDTAPTDGPAGKLALLASAIPASGSSGSLRLVAAPEGLRVIRESEADDPVSGVPLSDRFYLIEVRQQPGDLSYVPGAGFLALTATVRWPYHLRTGPEAGAAMAADLTQASTVVLNLALSP